MTPTNTLINTPSIGADGQPSRGQKSYYIRIAHTGSIEQAYTDMQISFRHMEPNFAIWYKYRNVVGVATLIDGTPENEYSYEVELHEDESGYYAATLTRVSHR